MAELDRFVRIEECARVAGNIHRQTVWKWSKRGIFPKVRRFGPNMSGVLESELKAWLEKRRNPENLQAEIAELKAAHAIDASEAKKREN